MTTEEMNIIEKLCEPLIEILKKHPYHSITIDAEHIEVNNTVMRMPVADHPIRFLEVERYEKLETEADKP